jgi:hypothetical protein
MRSANHYSKSQPYDGESEGVRPAPQNPDLGGEPPDPGSPHQQPTKAMLKIPEKALREGSQNPKPATHQSNAKDPQEILRDEHK